MLDPIDISRLISEDPDIMIDSNMYQHFVDRTNRHRCAVKGFCNKILDYDGNRFDGLMQRAENHDKSKFEEPELEPYIYLTWDYKCKDDGTSFDIADDIRDAIDNATKHHIITNPHHPECHCDNIDDELIDATKMSDVDIAEMVADWCAMSKEKDNSPRDWANKNINVKWKFTNPQNDLIYELIDAIWAD